VLHEGLPSVLVDTDTNLSTMHSVMPDYVQGAYQATRYLLGRVISVSLSFKAR
jgi:DNA-binding LacI/PurR family transcriptional regulator